MADQADRSSHLRWASSSRSGGPRDGHRQLVQALHPANMVEPVAMRRSVTITDRTARNNPLLHAISASK